MNSPQLRFLSVVGVSLALGGAVLVAEDGKDALWAPPAREAHAKVFVTSKACAKCHSNSEDSSAMRDEKARWVAPYDLWEASMMGNASRDPLYRAVVSLEAAATPSRRSEIEGRCLGCHAPLAAVELEKAGEFTPELALLRQDSVRGQLALDGVACTVCHQIQPKGLGTPSSFNGGYTIDEDRVLFGPHPTPDAGLMKKAVGFTPAHGDHMLDASLCGTCHTQHNEAYRADGTPTGALYPEQASYLEWRNSIYAVGERGRSCQSCHMPTTSQDGKPLASAIARGADGKDVGGLSEREPYGRHLFVGANTLMLGILRDNAELLNPRASREAFNETLARTRTQLRQAAKLTVGSPTLDESELSFAVRVHNLSGHKLPTGHPTRRAWLRVVIWDAEERVVFRSGDVDQRGRIVDGQGAVLASELAGGPLAAHQTEVTRSAQVQIYEAVMKGEKGALTYLLTRAVGHRKDTRLLPLGWRFEAPQAGDTLPQGLGGDKDFLAGGDSTPFRIDVGNRPGPFTVKVSLLYQTLGARYAAELFTHDTPELRSFRTLYQNAQRTPETIAETTVRSAR